jgi:hypothetical protein
MQTWKESARSAAIPGALASVASAIALVATARLERERPEGPVNAISHWLWGDRALHHDGVSMRHTVLGYVIHHLSATFWAVLYQRFLHRPNRTPAVVLRDAAIASAVACTVDFKLTPHRLTPGYEHRLSRRSLAVVYTAFAVGLAAAALFEKR